MKRTGKDIKAAIKKSLRAFKAGTVKAKAKVKVKAKTPPKAKIKPAVKAKAAKAPALRAPITKTFIRSASVRSSSTARVSATQPFIQREERYIPENNGQTAHAAPAPKEMRLPELPRGYGDNTIWLMVRDPNCLYTYWEIRSEVEQQALSRLGGVRNDVTSVLRVYDLTYRAKPAFFDITLQNMADDWYVQVGANRCYVIEIGLRHRDGRFIALARSNEVTTPRDGMSEVMDEEWMDIDFDKVYALSGGFQVGLSSQEMRKLMQQRLEGAVTSGSGAGHLSSLSSPSRAQKDRKFWFVLDCELIVYGATEPDATVTINGSPVQLRPDGTFTLRYALPDGRVRVDARAHSADGVEERVIIPDVERKTSRPDPIFKKAKGAKA